MGVGIPKFELHSSKFIILMAIIIKSKARDFTFRSLAFISRLERKPFIIILSSSFSEKNGFLKRPHRPRQKFLTRFATIYATRSPVRARLLTMAAVSPHSC